MRLINVNDVYKLFDRDGTAKFHVSDIDTIPSVDAKPINHARWITLPSSYTERAHHCSFCGYATGKQYRLFNYCPKCGAKMDEKPKK